jgi:periplasmic divalent cation tolerance protein
MNRILGAGPMEDCKDLDILIVTTTVGSEADAERLAREIMTRRLAACVQIEALRSFYHWQGRLCDEPEWRLVIKAAPAHGDRLRAVLAQTHPYELPQVAAWTARASSDYAAWVRSEVAPPT